MKTKQILTGFAAAALSFTLSTQATLVAFDIFDYGESGGNLNTFGGAENGWAGGWTGNSNPNFNPNVNLEYTATGYNNAGNTGGSAFYGGSNAGAVADRSLVTPLSGTIWVSVLMQIQESSSGEGLLWFRTDNSSSNYIGIRANSTNSEIRVAGGDTNLSNSFTADIPHLLVAEIQFDATGNDTVNLWINPDLSTGEPTANPSNADYYFASRSGQMGTQLTGIGVSADRTGSAIDAIRIGTSFDSVTAIAIPEPGTLMLVGIALGSLMLFRRRK